MLQVATLPANSGKLAMTILGKNKTRAGASPAPTIKEAGGCRLETGGTAPRRRRGFELWVRRGNGDAEGAVAAAWLLSL